MNRCSQCGTENQLHENFCYACGNTLKLLQSGKHCPGCHSEVGLEDQFCDNCGSPLPQWLDGNTRPMPQPAQTHMNPSQNLYNHNHQPVNPSNVQWNTTPPHQYTPTPYVEKKKKSRLPLILVLIIVVFVAGGGVYYYLAMSGALPASFPLAKKKDVPQDQQNKTEANERPKSESTSRDSNDQEKPTPKAKDQSIGYGFTEKYRGNISESFFVYNVADLDGNGRAELILADSNLDGSNIKVLTFNKQSFVATHSVDIPGSVFEINTSRPEFIQHLYVSSEQKSFLVYLDIDTDQLYYEHVDFFVQPWSVAEGYLDGDDQVDLVLFTEGDEGLILTVTTSQDPGDMFVLETYIADMFMADFNGDGLTELIYTTFDMVEAYVSILYWENNGLHEAMKSTLGGSLISYFPWDVDGDGASELITANVQNDSIEIRILTYDANSQQFQIMDQIPIDDPSVMHVGLLAGDFDGDGKADILALTFDKDTYKPSYIMYSR